MVFLLAVSILWAFSFGIIGSRLAGFDSNLAATLRLGIAFCCFLPFFRYKKLAGVDVLKLVGIGALQFGLMYVAYMRAYAYLPSHLVALFSVLTPVYIVLAHSTMSRSWRWSLLGCALLSIAGGVVIKYTLPSGSFWTGFALMQIANISFGIGQLLYRSWKRSKPEVKDSEAMAALYLGGTMLAGVGFAIWGDPANSSPTSEQWLALIYLGAIASGLGFFWWNKGASQSKAGTLAAFNNAIVPIAMAVSLFVFGEASAVEPTSIAQLALGSVLIFAAIAWGQKSGANR